tara:strand:- start:69313 stop:70611 length:1299 start_codon:yes stop_codon:yes gene_type:complete
MKKRETENSTRVQDNEIVNPPDQSRTPPRRTLSFVTAIGLTCLVGWWVQSVRASGGLSLPYVRPDVIVINFLCMLPLAILASEWILRVLKQRSFHLCVILQALFFVGTAVISILSLTGDQTSVTLSDYDAWESFAFRPAMAFWMMTSVLLAVGNLSRTPATVQTSRSGTLVWLLVWTTALIVPAIYTQSRVDEMVASMNDYLGSGRIGDARQVTREVCLLSPWEKMGGLPVGDMARDLDKECFGIEQRLALMKRRPVHSEEYTYHEARLLSMLGQRAVAIRLLEPWAGKDATSPLTCQLLGNIFQQQENWADSERQYQQALKAWQKLPLSEQQQAGIVTAWKGMAFAERKRGNYEEAEAAYLSALALAPTADQHFLLAQFYEDTQQTGKARDHAHQAMALDAARYDISGKKLIASLQQKHFGCLNVWRNGNP